MSKFTPGPWYLSFGSKSGAAKGIHSNGQNVVNFGGISRPMSEEGAANARLIACAPELYETLISATADVRRILELTEKGGQRNEAQRAFLAQIDELLDRAGRV